MTDKRTLQGFLEKDGRLIQVSVHVSDAMCRRTQMAEDTTLLVIGDSRYDVNLYVVDLGHEEDRLMETEELEDTISELKLDIENRDDDLRKLESQINTLNEELCDSENETYGLQDELKDKDKEIKSLSAELEKLENDN